MTKQKNPAAVALGKLGGAKGGKARAAKLSKKKRSEIAKKAAAARWSKKGQDLYFWNDARKYGHRCAIDCSVLVGHYDSTTDITW
jgi:predicted lipoprotein with Yx(FWY)xxD motif